MTLATKLEALTKDQMEQVHEAALQVMEQTGVVFDDEETLALFKKHGAKVEGKIVYIPRKMVEEGIAQCPKSFCWTGRDDAYSIKIGGDSQVAGPLIGAVHVYEDNKRREGTAEDMVNITKLTQSSPVLDIVSMNSVEPGDIEVFKRPLQTAYHTLRNTTKPILGYSVLSSPQQTKDYLGLIELACGPFDKVKIAHVMTSFSPLKYDGPVLKVLKEFVERKQAVMVTPCALTGVSCPIDLLGASVLQLVEPLALNTWIQLFNPGTPMVINLSTAIAHLSRVTSAWGSPESILLSMPNIQMYLDYYHLPVRINAGVATSKKPDYQAAMETMQGTMTSLLSGANIVYSVAGVLENVMTFSFEKFIMDEEMLSRIYCLRKGIEFSEETMSVQTIHDVGHGGSYLMHKSTLRKFRSRWMPTVSDWNMAADYDADIMANARQALKSRLTNAPESLLDPDLDKELRRYMELKGAAI